MNLSHNALTGSVPSTYCNALGSDSSAFVWMDLSGNSKLSCIPSSLSSSSSCTANIKVDDGLPSCSSVARDAAVCALTESTNIMTLWNEWSCQSVVSGGSHGVPVAPPCGVRNASTGSIVTGVWRGVVCNDANELVKLDLSPLGRRLSGRDFNDNAELGGE